MFNSALLRHIDDINSRNERKQGEGLCLGERQNRPKKKHMNK